MLASQLWIRKSPHTHLNQYSCQSFSIYGAAAGSVIKTHHHHRLSLCLVQVHKFKLGCSLQYN